MLQIVKPGSDQVAAINAEILTVMAVIMVALIAFWLLSILIDGGNNVYAKFGATLMLEELVFSIFMFALVQPVVAVALLILSATVSIPMAIVCIKLDELIEEDQKEYKKTKKVFHDRYGRKL